MAKSVLKWVALGMAAVLVLMGCEYDDDEEGPGSAPVIWSVELYSTSAPNVVEDNFYIGDSMTYWINATDADADMVELWITHYYPNDSKTVYYGPDLDVVPTNTGKTLEFNSPKTFAIDAPRGSWRADFYMVDSKGNRSKTFPVYYHVR